MKKSFLVFSFIILSCFCRAQSDSIVKAIETKPSELQSNTDTLITENDIKIPVLITEISRKEVIYRIPSKSNMPLLHYSRKDLNQIILKDGTTIDPLFQSVNPFKNSEEIKSKSIISFIQSKLLQRQLGIAYEYLFKKNKVGIKVPFCISLFDVTKNYDDNNVYSTYPNDNKRFFSTGIDINYYPRNLGRIRYLVGIGLQYAQYYYEESYYTANPYGPVFSYTYHNPKVTGYHYSFVINNGLFLRLNKHFIMTGSTGVGLQYETAVTYNHNLKVRFNGTFGFGYMF